MKDTELRGIILQKFYEKRRGSLFTPKPEDFSGQIKARDIFAICDQLGKYRLIEWYPRMQKCIVSKPGITIDGHGKITAFGIDVVEGEALPDIKVKLAQNRPITNNISNISIFSIGDHKQQNNSYSIQEIMRVIDESQVTLEQKAEAKGLLRKLLDHPLATTIAGGVLSVFSM